MVASALYACSSGGNAELALQELESQGRIDEARALLERSRETAEDSRARLHFTAELALFELRHDRAESAQREAQRALVAAAGLHEWDELRAIVQGKVGRVYAKTQPERARTLLEAALEGRSRSHGPEVAYASEEAGALLDVYEALGLTTEHGVLEERREAPLRLAGDRIEEIAVVDLLESRTWPAYLRSIPIAVELPAADVSARGATEAETRRAVLQAFEIWQDAVRRVVPEFAFDIQERAPDAPIRARWLRRAPTYLPAFGRVTAHAAVLELAPTPIPVPASQVDAHALRSAALHAIGAVLGLPDCVGCDSVMNEDWRAVGLYRPSDLDVRSVARLVREAGAARDALPDVAARPAGVLADLPFINAGTGHQIVIDIAAEGQNPFVVLLDTGANTTILTSALARVLGVSVRSVKSDQYVRATATGDPVSFWVTGQRVIEAREEWNFALLGGQYMERYVVELDFGAQRVRFLDPAQTRVGDRDNERVVELRMAEKRPYARVEMGSGAVWALVDTGAQTPLSTTEEKARALGIAIDPDARRVRHRNVLGTSASASQRLDRISMGGVELEDVELQIGLRDESVVRVQRWLVDETLIGIDLLRHYVVRFDYPRGRMGLTPLAKPAPIEDAL